MTKAQDELMAQVILAVLTARWVFVFLAGLAVATATINVVGGFMVTDRMMSMFKGKR